MGKAAASAVPERDAGLAQIVRGGLNIHSVADSELDKFLRIFSHFKSRA